MDAVIGVATIGFFLWISLKILKLMFLMAKKTIGWVGPYIMAAIPAAGAYFITYTLFGVGISEASISGFLTALIIGTVMNGAS